MTLAYHEANPADLNAILAHGLKRKSRGDKGDDKAIIQTDQLLDSYRPTALKLAGVSRDDTIYAYWAHDGRIIGITDGKPQPLRTFIAESEQAVLELEIDPKQSYVSDLDAYDTVKRAVEHGASRQDLRQLAAEYWALVTPLDHYPPYQFKRPEIMITYDLEPKHITHVGKEHPN